MQCILSGIEGRKQPIQPLAEHPGSYRPSRGPSCGKAGLGGHGRDPRAAGRSRDDRHLNGVLIPRFSGPGCAKTGSRSSRHRLLQQPGRSGPTIASQPAIQRRSLVAAHAGDIGVGEVLQGPQLVSDGRGCKSYRVSLMEDASRWIAESAVCGAETALEIEGVLKQAVLKRAVPVKRVVDHAAADRANTLPAVCALRRFGGLIANRSQAHR